MTTSSPKLFIEIVQQLRSLIEEERIPIGGKLPSERVLAEQLDVGRSTIREALRSLELLGLIETRRGEGTFLADYRKHQLVEVLAAFILQDTKSSEDVTATRITIEKQAMADVMQRNSNLFRTWKNALDELETIKRDWLIKEIVIASGNRLSFKIWLLLTEYSGKPYQKDMTPDEMTLWHQLLDALEKKNRDQAYAHYDAWFEYIKGRT
ncbi:FadR/GntR family transcriptional regulator [Chryseomicrobium palamuruense]|uniref:FadR/GntR family transcriptional regulator n=1 Tax=Chryseomicrobium palamuruense TaxID=682973 RepID=A0ABV8UZ68_9BACL